MTALVAWLLGSRAGLGLVLAAAALSLCGVVAWRMFAVGRAREQAETLQNTLTIILKKVASDETLMRMSDAQRREYVRRWVRKE